MASDAPTAEQLAMIHAAMMEELGIGRKDELPLQDRGPDLVRGALPVVKPRGILNNPMAEAWNNLTFDDVDPSQEELDSIADGQLYRMRKAAEGVPSGERGAYASGRSHGGARGGRGGYGNVGTRGGHKTVQRGDFHSSRPVPTRPRAFANHSNRGQRRKDAETSARVEAAIHRLREMPSQFVAKPKKSSQRLVHAPRFNMANMDDFFLAISPALQQAAVLSTVQPQISNHNSGSLQGQETIASTKKPQSTTNTCGLVKGGLSSSIYADKEHSKLPAHLSHLEGGQTQVNSSVQQVSTITTSTGGKNAANNGLATLRLAGSITQKSSRPEQENAQQAQAVSSVQVESKAQLEEAATSMNDLPDSRPPIMIQLPKKGLSDSKWADPNCSVRSFNSSNRSSEKARANSSKAQSQMAASAVATIEDEATAQPNVHASQPALQTTQEAVDDLKQEEKPVTSRKEVRKWENVEVQKDSGRIHVATVRVTQALKSPCVVEVDIGSIRVVEESIPADAPFRQDEHKVVFHFRHTKDCSDMSICTIYFSLKHQAIAFHNLVTRDPFRLVKSQIDQDILDPLHVPQRSLPTTQHHTKDSTDKPLEYGRLSELSSMSEASSEVVTLTQPFSQVRLNSQTLSDLHSLEGCERLIEIENGAQDPEVENDEEPEGLSALGDLASLNNDIIVHGVLGMMNEEYGSFLEEIFSKVTSSTLCINATQEEILSSVEHVNIARQYLASFFAGSEIFAKLSLREEARYIDDITMKVLEKAVKSRERSVPSVTTNRDEASPTSLKDLSQSSMNRTMEMEETIYNGLPPAKLGVTPPEVPVLPSTAKMDSVQKRIVLPPIIYKVEELMGMRGRAVSFEEELLPRKYLIQPSGRNTTTTFKGPTSLSKWQDFANTSAPAEEQTTLPQSVQKPQHIAPQDGHEKGIEKSTALPVRNVNQGNLESTLTAAKESLSNASAVLSQKIIKTISNIDDGPAADYLPLYLRSDPSRSSQGPISGSVGKKTTTKSIPIQSEVQPASIGTSVEKKAVIEPQVFNNSDTYVASIPQCKTLADTFKRLDSSEVPRITSSISTMKAVDGITGSSSAKTSNPQEKVDVDEDKNLAAGPPTLSVPQKSIDFKGGLSASRWAPPSAHKPNFKASTTSNKKLTEVDSTKPGISKSEKSKENIAPQGLRASKWASPATASDFVPQAKSFRSPDYPSTTQRMTSSSALDNSLSATGAPPVGLLSNGSRMGGVVQMANPTAPATLPTYETVLVEDGMGGYKEVTGLRKPPPAPITSYGLGFVAPLSSIEKRAYPSFPPQDDMHSRQASNESSDTDKFFAPGGPVRRSAHDRIHTESISTTGIVSRNFSSGELQARLEKGLSFR